MKKFNFTSIEEKKKPITNKKLFYLEVMRVFAIFFVIFNHTKENGFCLFVKEQPGSFQFWIYLFLSIFCKFAVALFFAISGAVMLGKEDEPLKKLWKKRILKMSIILIIFSIIYYLQKNGNNIQIKKFVMQLYSSNIKAHLWYLYAYMAYLICLPFLRSMVKNLDNKYFYYMIGIFLFFKAVVPIEEYIVSLRKI